MQDTWIALKEKTLGMLLIRLKNAWRAYEVLFTIYLLFNFFRARHCN